MHNPLTSRQYTQLRFDLQRQTAGYVAVPFPVALPTPELMALTMHSDASRFVRHVTADVYEPGYRPRREDCFRVTAVSLDRGRSFYLVQNGRGTVTDGRSPPSGSGGRYATPVRLRVPASSFPDLHPDAAEFALYCLQAALHYVPADHSWGPWEPLRTRIEQAAVNQLRGARYLLGVAHHAYRLLPNNDPLDGLDDEARFVEAVQAYGEAAAGYQAVGLRYSYGHCLLEEAIANHRLAMLYDRVETESLQAERARRARQKKPPTTFMAPALSTQTRALRRRALELVESAHEVFRPIRGATNVSYRTKHLRDDLLAILHGTVGF